MLTIILTLVGGIGLFILGMALLTDGLKLLAGDRLREYLTRFTGGRVSAIATGAGITTLIQSSTATTVLTIGLVSAGFLTFLQSVGVVLGANLGTTSTGWLVALVGLRYSVSLIAFPLVALGAFLRIAFRDQVSAAGTGMAGFGLLFVGIDLLQGGMSGLSGLLEPSRHLTGSFQGLLLLVLIGFAMTVVMQSSSAAIATTLAALHAGAIDLPQAATLVVGQNVGTTVTAVLAAIGATIPAKRTALAHVVFNLGLAGIVLPLVPLLLKGAVAVTVHIDPGTGIVALAAFQTGIKLFGVLLLLPWIDRYAKIIERVLPEKDAPFHRHLDRTVTDLPAIGIEAGRRALAEATRQVLVAVRQRLEGPTEERRATRRLETLATSMSRIEEYMGHLRSNAESEGEHGRHVRLLTALDHAVQLVQAANQAVRTDLLRRTGHAAPVREAFITAIDEALPWLQEGAKGPPPAAIGLLASLSDIRRKARSAILHETAEGGLGPDVAITRLDALVWLDRVAYLAKRTLELLADDPGTVAVAEGPQVEAV